jgi:hypothetical protein
MTNTDTPAVAWRYRYPNDEAWQLTQDHDQAFKNTGEVEPLGVIPFGAAAPAPDVRDQIAAILTRAMQDGQGDHDVIALATDDLVALLGGGG